MLQLPAFKSTGLENVDANLAADDRRFADWIELVGGLDAAEQMAADGLANAETRLAACYPYSPDMVFAVPHLGCDHEAGVWRRDRQNWRDTIENLARFRAVNPRAQEAA